MKYSKKSRMSKIEEKRNEEECEMEEMIKAI